MPKPSKEYLEKLRKRYEQRKKEDKEWEEMMDNSESSPRSVCEWDRGFTDDPKEVKRLTIPPEIPRHRNLSQDTYKTGMHPELGKVEVELHEARLGSTIPYGKGAVPQYKVKELEDKAMKLEAEVYDLIVDVVNCEKR